MRDDSLTASVNYGDYDGTVEADHHDHHDLFALAKKHGIDTERYFILGVDFHIGETHGDELAHTFVSLLAVDAQAVKAYGVDAIQRSIDEGDGILPYVKFDIDASLTDVLLCFKRFNVVLKNSHIRTKGFRRSSD